MNRFDREHMDGTGDGLSIALGILETSRTLEEARSRVRDALLQARHAKDLDTLQRIRDAVAGAAAPTAAR